MKNECFILSSCNQWKEYSSATIIGVFTKINLLQDHIWKLFVDGDIEWDGQDINNIYIEVKSNYDDYYRNPEEYDDDFQVDIAIANDIEDYKESICSQIMNSSVRELHNRCTYIMIQEFELDPSME